MAMLYLPKRINSGCGYLKLLPICRANRKWTKTAAAHPLFQLLNIHPANLNQPPAGVKTILIISLNKLSSGRAWALRAELCNGNAP